MIENHFYKQFLCSCVFLFVLFCVSIPSEAWAAALYLQPHTDQYYQDDIFIEEIWLNTEGQEINAIELYLRYPKDILEFFDFSEGGSILKLWVKKPAPDKKNPGVLTLIGGVPNGFAGFGLVGKLVFQVKVKEGGLGKEDVKIEILDNSRVLLNDGKGTEAKLRSIAATLTILPYKSKIIKNQWQAELKQDTTPPEPFEIKLAQDSSVFDGKYFIVFSTYDKESGVDYYEVLETGDKKQRDWKKGESPYLLQDQSLKSIIKVKAVDKAGNERISEYRVIKKIPYWIALLILVGTGAIIGLGRKYKKYD